MYKISYPSDKDAKGIFEDFIKDFGNIENFLPNLVTNEKINELKIMPRINVSETNKEYIVEADMPGVEEKDLDISLVKRNLLIKGTREAKEEHKERNYHRIERSYGSFERSILLPDNIIEDDISAVLEHGLLTINLPKAEKIEEKQKKIKITAKKNIENNSSDTE